MNAQSWCHAGPFALVSAVVVAPVAACGSSSSHGSSSEAADGGSGALDAAPGLFGSGGEAGLLGDATAGPFGDLPTSPVLDGNPPANTPILFGPPSQGASTGGPCLFEPEADALYPQNWLRPRFRWTPLGGQNLFELRLHVPNQTSDLVVYTTNDAWTMPLAMWNALRVDSAGQSMTVTLRGGVLAGSTLTNVSLGSRGPLGIAPVEASGAIVYWTTSSNSALKGFSPGDESVATVLTPSQPTQNAFQCIGCHTSTPDGEFAAFSGEVGNDTWPDGLALIAADAGVVGSAPTFLGAGAAQAMAMSSLGIETFSGAHWATGDRREVVSLDTSGGAVPSKAQLEWIDLEAATAATATGTIARDGDPSGAGAPAWSHDGNTIAYVSTNHTCNGRLGRCDSDYADPNDPGALAGIYTVPYAGGAGGTAKPVAGASDPTYEQYYPSLSPDDALLAFNRIPAGLNMYDQPQSELFVVPISGGIPMRLAANDPPECTGKTSPGLTNSWPKWSPVAGNAGGSTYYWIIFSSTRGPGDNPQLYITSVVGAPDGTLTTHGAIYLWNQPPAENNHTPAWDRFKVPPAPPGTAQ
jgi:hypothetical protein